MYGCGCLFRWFFVRVVVGCLLVDCRCLLVLVVVVVVVVVVVDAIVVVVVVDVILMGDKTISHTYQGA